MDDTSLLYLDSDIFILCAGVGLLPDLVCAAGFELSRARRLRPLPHMLLKGRIPKKYSAAAIEKASAWCSRVKAIDRSPSPALVDQMIIPGVEAGEAFLFALVAESDSVVATGDKRACLALQASDCEAKARLRHKVICLETALWLLLERLEYPDLARSLTPAREHNRTLRILLSQGEETSEDSFRDGLGSYSRDLEERAGELLFRP